jgi:hypothetical protein
MAFAVPGDGEIMIDEIRSQLDRYRNRLEELRGYL